jgi:hypothetical protein
MNPYARRDSTRETLHQRLHSHEVQRRVEFLGRNPMLTCAEALLRLQASGLSEEQSLSVIRAQRHLFYVQLIDAAYFPCFQWRDLWLRESIGSSIKIFGDSKTKWQIALWFVEENAWLEGLRPVDLLDSSPWQVVCAAEWETSGLDSPH